MKVLTEKEMVARKHISPLPRIIISLIILLCLFTLVLPTHVARADETVIEAWVSRYVGPTDSSDLARGITVDVSGNVYVTGWTAGDTVNNYATIKYDNNGNELWTTISSVPGWSIPITVDNSGNVYVTGQTWNCFCYATIKYDSMGSELWVALGSGGTPYAIALDSLGNVYVTGDTATIKYDNDGSQQWSSSTYGGADSGIGARGMALDTSGNVYVTGIGTGTIKYDSAGNEMWRALDDAWAIALDSVGNVYVTGGSATIKYDNSGNKLWTADGTGTDWSTIAIDESSNVFIAGSGIIAKYDSAGNEQWVLAYPGTARDLVLDRSGNIYVTGHSNYDYATIKYDTDGTVIWIATYNGPVSGQDEAWAIAIDESENIFVTGDSEDISTNLDYATIKYAQTSLVCEQINTATGTGVATVCPSSGGVDNLQAKSAGTLAAEAAASMPSVNFPQGFFEFDITGLALSQEVTVTITYPDNIPTNAQYWKWGPIPGDPFTPQWYTIPIGSNDGDNVITITLQDNGWGDDLLTGPDGEIVDQGGPGWPAATGVPVFPSMYVGLAAALGVGVLAYLYRRRVLGRRTTEI